MIDIIAQWLETIPTDTALWVVVTVFITLDVVLGTVKAALNKTLSSTKARQGVLHKSAFFATMLLCNFVDIAQTVGDFGFHVPVSALCAIMIVGCEVLSICEHIKDMNPDINLSFLESSKKA